MITGSDIILSLDLAMSPGTVALATGGQIVARETLPGQRDQSRALMGIITDILAAQEWSFGQEEQDFRMLTAALCVTGPGSFTGIRIGIAVVQGLMLANPALKAAGVTAFDAAVHGAAQCLPASRASVFSVIESGRDHLFCQQYDSALRPVAAAEAVPSAGMRDWFCRRRAAAPPPGLSPDVSVVSPGLWLCGDGAARAAEILNADVNADADADAGLAPQVLPFRSGAEGAILAALAGRGGGADSLQPCYLLPPEISQPREAPRKIAE